MVNLPHDIAGLVERTYSRSIAAEELCDAGAAPEWVHALQSAEEELEKTKENKQLKATSGPHNILRTVVEFELEAAATVAAVSATRPTPTGQPQ